MAAAAILNFTTMLHFITINQIFTKFCKYILHLMGNQDKGYAEV
jgi:hypothetical protein